MALNPNALTTLAQAKAYLLIPVLETSQDALVEIWVNAASQDMESECNRILKAQTGLVEYHDGRNQNIVMLRQWPIIAVTELRIDTQSKFTDASTLVDPADYRVSDDGQSILYVAGRFPTGHRAVKATYNAGLATVPSDLEHAVLWAVSWYRNVHAAGDIGRTTKSKEGESTSYLQTSPQYVKDVVARYKRTEIDVPEMMMSNL